MRALALTGILMAIIGAYLSVVAWADQDIRVLPIAEAQASPWPVLMLLLAFGCGVMVGWGIRWFQEPGKPWL